MNSLLFLGCVNNVGVPVRVRQYRRPQQANSAAAVAEVLQAQHEEATRLVGDNQAEYRKRQ